MYNNKNKTKGSLLQIDRIYIIYYLLIRKRLKRVKKVVDFLGTKNMKI